MAADYELSEREIEIIRLVATGASNKEIAQALVISPNTVKVHLRNIFSKLEVASRTEATMVAIREGWVNSPGVEEEKLSALETESTDTVRSNFQTENSPHQDNSLRKFLTFPFLGVIGLGIILILGFVLVSQRLIPFQTENTPTSVTGVTQEQIDRWDILQAVPEVEQGMAAARYEQAFYLIGGETESGVSDHLWIYQINSDQWESGTNLPYPVKNIQAAVLGEMIYIPGGETASGNIINTFVVYDPREDIWRRLEPLPFAVSDYCLTAFEGKLYLFGGWSGDSYSDKILVYNPEDDQWVSFGNLPTPRSACSVSVVGGKIHVIGGKNNQGGLTDHDVFIPQRYLQNEDSWETAAKLPEPRYGMGSSVLADMIFIVGGVGNKTQNLSLIQYFPPKDVWGEIDQPEIPIGQYPAVLPFETRLYVIGGAAGEKLQANHQVYQAVYTILVPIVR